LVLKKYIISKLWKKVNFNKFLEKENISFLLKLNLLLLFYLISYFNPASETYFGVLKERSEEEAE